MTTQFFITPSSNTLIIKQGGLYATFYNCHGDTLQDLRSWWGNDTMRGYATSTKQMMLWDGAWADDTYEVTE